MARRTLFAIAGLALVLHGIGISRTIVPAQDGLKFIRVAGQFQTKPWGEVVRGSDQHPLYSAVIAGVEPLVASGLGRGPNAWRVAAQLVSVAASLLTLIPLYGLARALFGQQAALLTTLVYALLPIPAAIGRDTLSDSLFLLFFATTLRLGEVALRTGRLSAWIGTGLAAGVGYVVRPEILIVPVAVVVTALLPRFASVAALARARLAGRGIALSPPGSVPGRSGFLPFAAIGLSTLLTVGSYALVKGELSEKLSIRFNGGLGASQRTVRSVPPPVMPRGLDDKRWDFSPKEESGEVKLAGSVRKTSIRLAQQWAEGLGWIMLPLLVWGVVRMRGLEGSHLGRRLVLVYVILFSAVVIRHATSLNYLSGRHALTLVLATVPWVGAGIWAWTRNWAARRGLSPRGGRRVAIAAITLLVGLGVTVQVKGMHPSRWGHHAAGEWLLAHSTPDEAVLDTRGWALFVRGGSGYDYWHVRQALTDHKLAYIVVGTDELKAHSKRAATLRALLAYAATPVAQFPDREGQESVGVQVYRFIRPPSWEAMAR
jgi:hypothetical protein